MMPGAMPFLHRCWGNPMFSAIARSWFRAPIHDVYCGMRGFTKDGYERFDQHCTGMEFATEMIVKSSLFGARMAEVPITLHPDGRKAHAPHLRTFRDGWRTLRFFLIYSPRWLFAVPGAVLVLLGLVGYGLAMPGATIAGVTFEAHTLVVSSLAILCGYQTMLFAIFTMTFATSEGLRPPTPGYSAFYRVMTLERGIIVSSLALVAGLGALFVAVNKWRLFGFGHLDYAETMRWVVPGVTADCPRFPDRVGQLLLRHLRIAPAMTTSPSNRRTRTADLGSTATRATTTTRWSAVSSCRARARPTSPRRVVASLRGTTGGSRRARRRGAGLRVRHRVDDALSARLARGSQASRSGLLVSTLGRLPRRDHQSPERAISPAMVDVPAQVVRRCILQRRVPPHRARRPRERRRMRPRTRCVPAGSSRCGRTTRGTRALASSCTGSSSTGVPSRCLRRRRVGCWRRPVSTSF